MSNIGPMLNQVLLQMHAELLEIKDLTELQIVWLEMMFDIVDFGDSIHEMSEVFLDSNTKDTPDDNTAKILKNLFNNGEEDND